MRIAILAMALLAVGCVMDSGDKVKVIDCGTLDFTDNNGELRDTVSVSDGKCTNG